MSRDHDLPQGPAAPQVPSRRLLLKGAAAAGALTAASALPGIAHAAPPKATPYVNPLVQQRADPHIHRHTDGHYYFTATAPEYDRIVLRRSRTLNGLSTAAESVLWRAHPTGDMGAHIWAPELHRIGGKWYIYFAAAPAEDVWQIRIWVLENSHPNPSKGTWVEKGQVKTAWETFSSTPPPSPTRAPATSAGRSTNRGWTTTPVSSCPRWRTRGLSPVLKCDCPHPSWTGSASASRSTRARTP